MVFAALGATQREAGFYRAAFAESGRGQHMVLFVNLAEDPGIERLQTPRLALTAAEYLAWDAGLHVLVVMTLDLAWELLGRFPRRELTRIQQRHLDRHDFPAEPGSGGAGR